ncbi:hypothetical protein Emed_004359 [Eimeria media]
MPKKKQSSRAGRGSPNDSSKEGGGGAVKGGSRSSRGQQKEGRGLSSWKASIRSSKGGQDGVGAPFIAALRAAGLVVRSIVADGNCLFRAAADQLYGDQGMHMKLREAAVSYIRSHPDDFQAFLDTEEESFDEYVKRLSREGTWGGQLELQAISLAHKVNLLIYVPLEGGAPETGKKGRASKNTPNDESQEEKKQPALLWDTWKMQNFDSSAFCMQLAFSPNMQHYSSVRLAGAPTKRGPSKCEAPSYEALKAKGRADHGGLSSKPCDVSQSNSGQSDADDEGSRRVSQQDDAQLNKENSTNNNSSSSSSGSSSLDSLRSLTALRDAMITSPDLGPLCPACLAAKRTAWRQGSLLAQVNAWGGGPDPSAPFASHSHASSPDSKEEAAADLQAALASVRPRSRSCEPQSCSQAHGRRSSISNIRGSRSSSSHNCGNSFVSTTGSQEGSETGERVFVASWEFPPPLRTSARPKRLTLLNACKSSSKVSCSSCSSSSSCRNSKGSSDGKGVSCVRAAATEGFFYVDSSCLYLPAGDAVCSDADAGATLSPAAAAAAGAAAAAAAAAEAAARKLGNGSFEAPVEWSAWSRLALLRIMLPPLPSVRSSRSNSKSNQRVGIRRSLSLPSLRLCMLPCARLWVRPEEKAAVRAAPESEKDAEASSASSAASNGGAQTQQQQQEQEQQRQQQQQPQQPSRKGKLSKKEKLALKREKRHQRLRERAERRRLGGESLQGEEDEESGGGGWSAARAATADNASPSLGNIEGDCTTASLEKLAELTSRLLTV